MIVILGLPAPGGETEDPVYANRPLADGLNSFLLFFCLDFRWSLPRATMRSGNDSKEVEFMKIILLKNVEKLGKAGEIKNVADGFALNFLLPKKMAEAATTERIEKLRNKEIKKSREREKGTKDNNELLARLNGLKLEIKAKASDSGKLFAGLSAEDIAKELKTQKNIDIAAKRIRLEKHIKEVGEHGVEIDVENQKRASIVVAVRGL